MRKVETELFNDEVSQLYIPEFKKHLESKGIYADNIYFELNKQGAGASFEGIVNPKEFIFEHNLYHEFRATYVNKIPSLKIRSNGSLYNHAETMLVINENEIRYDIDCRPHFSRKCASEFDDFVNYVLETCKDYAREFYHKMDDEYWNRVA